MTIESTLVWTALVIESAATSLKKDRHVKLPAYASAGIQEYWIVDLEGESLTVFREPDGGAYRNEQTFAGEAVVPGRAVP